MRGRHAAYLALFIIAPALLMMPTDSFAQSPEDPLDTTMIDDSVSDGFAPDDNKRGLRSSVGYNAERLYRVELTWDPVEIKPNKMVTFDVKITDVLTNRPAENVYYDFAVLKDDRLIKELKNSLALRGLVTHTVEFPTSGSFRVVVNVLGGGDLSNQANELNTFDLRVVPEFPAGTIIAAVTLIGITIALTRFTALSRGAGKGDSSFMAA